MISQRGATRRFRGFNSPKHSGQPHPTVYKACYSLAVLHDTYNVTFDLNTQDGSRLL